MSDLPLVLESETPDDAEAIQHLNERVFGPGRFARTAYRIRERADPDPSLSFVARVGTLMVGANAMTPIVIGEAKALLLGPLIVEPVFRSQGIGEALVARSLEAARAQGLETRHTRGRRTLLRACRVPARSHRPHRTARTSRSHPPALLRARGRGARSRRGRGAPRLKSATDVYNAARKYVCRAPFCRIADFSKEWSSWVILRETEEKPLECWETGWILWIFRRWVGGSNGRRSHWRSSFTDCGSGRPSFGGPAMVGAGGGSAHGRSLGR